MVELTASKIVNVDCRVSRPLLFVTIYRCL